MARVTVEDCIDKVENRFDLVLLAAYRARSLHNGEEPTVSKDNDKAGVVALREIAEETVSTSILKEEIIKSLQLYNNEEDNIDDDAANDENTQTEENQQSENQEKVENIETTELNEDIRQDDMLKAETEILEEQSVEDLDISNENAKDNNSIES